MSIFSTINLSKDELINAIKERMDNLDKMSKIRLTDVLESLVQYKDYDEKQLILNEEEDSSEWEIFPNPSDEVYFYNNFSSYGS